METQDTSIPRAKRVILRNVKEKYIIIMNICQNIL